MARGERASGFLCILSAAGKKEGRVCVCGVTYIGCNMVWRGRLCVNYAARNECGIDLAV